MKNKIKSQAACYTEPLFVGGKSIVTSQTYLGKNVNFNGMSISGGGKVTIGDNFHSGAECVMLTTIHNYEGAALPYDDTVIHKDITIEDNVWLGHRVIVLGGLTIGEGAIIQAGSVVVSDIPKYAIAGGHPCKPFKQRDIEHYIRLKEEGKFH
ncbi:MAG: acyltransferase [Sulfurovaceae bacterium]